MRTMRTTGTLIRGEQGLHLRRVFESLCNLKNGNMSDERFFL